MCNFQVTSKALTKYERPRMKMLSFSVKKTVFLASISFHFRPFVFR